MGVTHGLVFPLRPALYFLSARSNLTGVLYQFECQHPWLELDEGSYFTTVVYKILNHQCVLRILQGRGIIKQNVWRYSSHGLFVEARSRPIEDKGGALSLISRFCSLYPVNADRRTLEKHVTTSARSMAPEDDSR